MSEIKVDIGQYKEVNKGSLKAFFSLVIYPMGQKILNCSYFVKDNQSWFSFPSKEIKKGDGEKSDYIPYISYLDKKYLENLKIAVLEALKTAKPQEYNDKSYQSKSYKGETDSLQGIPSDLW